MNIFNCWVCSKELEYPEGYEPTYIIRCEKCDKDYKEQRKKMITDYAALKVKVMYDNALRTMEKAKMYMYEYERSSKKIYEMALSDTEYFMSSHEMIAAIILEEYNLEFMPNYKIDRYKVDLFIPGFKVCLEIDGTQHDKNLEYDNNRDIEIRKKLGSEWEVVRVKTKFLEETPDRLIDEIEYIRNRKQKLRKTHDGIIPEYFSPRERAHYKSILGEKTIKVFKK